MGAVAGVVLAGGRSSRMGRDKALIPLNGEPLIRRQLRLLQESGARRLMVSVAAGDPEAGDRLREEIPTEVECLPDARPDCGPLAGIAAGLASLRSDESHLIVLAVDLPRMEGGFLGLLFEAVQGTPDAGVVPQVDGNLEPLVAVYPRLGLASALTRLERGDLSVQEWVREGLRGGWMRTHVVSEAEAGTFLNWNRPEDLPDARV
jgi:molybdopterin-guanine dinucleotide biosynthesis protein A